jgi:uncharacterized protein YjiS (DUF1127 family)
MMLPKPSAEERTMTPRIKTHPTIGKLIDAFGNWRKHRQEIREIRDLDDDEFANLAHELRITPADLDTFVRQGPHAVDELPKLLTALGIDEQALSRTQPLVLRDMVRVCASCQQKHKCDRDLNAGTAAQHYEEYCLNASTIDALDQSRLRTGRGAMSAENMSQRLTKDVDAWAEAHDTVRSDAIRQLVELGLSSTRPVGPLGALRRDPVEIEDLAADQIGRLLDPSLPVAERERRIRRLTDGPPEFSDERIDLPLRG